MCTCVCVCVCMYVCVRMYACVRTCVRVCVCMHVCACVHLCTRVDQLYSPNSSPDWDKHTSQTGGEGGGGEGELGSVHHQLITQLIIRRTKVFVNITAH